MAEDVSQEELMRAFNSAIDSEAVAFEGGEAEQAAIPGDVKNFFCSNWPMIKQVLAFIGDQAGGIVRLALKGVVAVGDVLHGRLC